MILALFSPLFTAYAMPTTPATRATTTTAAAGLSTKPRVSSPRSVRAAQRFPQNHRQKVLLAFLTRAIPPPQVFLVPDESILPNARHLAALDACRHEILSWAAAATAPKRRPSLRLGSRVRGLARRMTPTSVTALSALTNVLLSAFKLAIGLLSGSAALVADGAHSFSDLISDAVCWATTGRAEHAGALGIAGMLLATGGAMTLHSGRALLAALQPAAAAAPRAALELAPLLVAVASVASKELLFRLTYDVGTRCNSAATIANAYHHRSDALSSVVALVGIGGAMAGWAWLDPLAATAVGGMVAWMGVEIARESVGAIVAPPPPLGADAPAATPPARPVPLELPVLSVPSKLLFEPTEGHLQHLSRRSLVVNA